MSLHKNTRPRIHIDISEETHTELNELLGEMRVKTALFRKIAEDLVTILRKLSPAQRRFFIVSILEGDLDIKEYNRKVKAAVEGVENER